MKAQKSKGLNMSDTMKKVAKIHALPQNVRESIPFQGCMDNGVIETYPGTFTKTYPVHDINFNIAPPEEQAQIFKQFMELENSFNEGIKWQFNIYNHEVDKKSTIENLRILPQTDGLNNHRQEMNKILLSNLKNGSNSIKQEKYLTIAVDDKSSEHAAVILSKLDTEINKKLKKICKRETKPLSTMERLKLLYDIYNQDDDYRMSTGVYNGKETFDLSFIERCGLSVKDIVGPSSFDFSSGSMIQLGDTYAQVLYLRRVPTYLSTNFISDLSDIQCSMLISISEETTDRERAVKLVKSRMADIEERAAKIQVRNSESGYFGQLPPDLERQQENARSLLTDISKRDQNIFFITVTVAVFARTREQLMENVKMVKSVGAQHFAPMKSINYQQEFALNTTLPLCRNDLFVELLHTTESASVFIPYNSQEINQKNAVFYGLNQTTKCMILYDRLTGSNYNGLIFGGPGSGKSFITKCEITSVLLNHPDAQIFVIDPQGEYYPLAHAFNGQEIKLFPGSNSFINPLDLDITEGDDDEVDPLTLKVDYIIGMFEIMLPKGSRLGPVHTGIIDKCVRKIYKSYIEELHRRGVTCDLTICPTLTDLYHELLAYKSEKIESGDLADVLYQYSVGSFDTFAHRTNVNTFARLVVYNIKRLGTGMKELGLHVCTNDSWNRMIANSKKRIYTWLYIDEFHLLLASDRIAEFLKTIWKMARKWLGVPTGIMQNTEDLLRNADTRAIINTTFFVIMLKSALMDRQNLAELYHLSGAQLEYITESDEGYGLIYNGKTVLPFMYEFPKDTQLYRIFSTKRDVEGVAFA